jgi:putative endopeptidase
MKIHIVPAIALFLILFSCKQRDSKIEPDFLADNIDQTVSPAQDFFSYANGGWIKRTPIPEAESGWGVGDMVLEEIYGRLKKINEDALKENAAQGTISQKIGDFWFSSMDTLSIEKSGLTPLRENLELIRSIKNKSDLIKACAELHNIGINVFFNDLVVQDDKKSDEMAYQLSQGGLGMPNRDYYFNTDQRTQGVKKAYRVFLFKTFEELGSDSLEAEKKSASVFSLETKLAGASRKLADLRDPNKNYNKMSLSGLKQLSPDFNWSLYLEKTGISKLDSVLIGQPEFFREMNQEIKNESLESCRDYLRFQLVRRSADYLDNQTYGNLFDYYKLLTGASKPRERWKRALDAEERAMGEALGQLFVKQYFSEQARQRYRDLVEAFRTAFRERIANLTWMSDSTKQKAFAKLAGVTKKVGYPEKWKDFSALKIDRGPYVLNIQRAREWWHYYFIKKLGKPVDRTEWDMTPQTYNAQYSPSNNEIVLPAAQFVVPGKRDEELDDAFVYGYAGASTIGHEITHGFDDQGRQYDEKGNLRNWWSPSDSIEFVKRTQKIIRQFNEFIPVDTLHINGDATQGENIADLGGLLLGLDAFRKTDSYRKGEKIGGFDPLQRYFLGYAYGWLSQQKKESLAMQVMSDVHAPAKERVNGPMANIPEFYEAFGVKPGDKMYRADSLRVSIW